MAWRCKVFGCSNVADLDSGISVHISPSQKSESDKWKRFIRLHRRFPDGEKLDGKFGVCSKHFEKGCFLKAFHVKGQQRRLKPGAIPSIWGCNLEKDAPMTARDRRMVGRRKKMKWPFNWNSPSYWLWKFKLFRINNCLRFLSELKKYQKKTTVRTKKYFIGSFLMWTGFKAPNLL